MKINWTSMGLAILGGVAMASNPILGIACVGASYMNHRKAQAARDAGADYMKDLLDGKHGEDMRQGMINTLNGINNK